MKIKLMTAMATVALVVGLSGAGLAQVKTDPGVARISMIHGEVSTQRGDSGEWSAAALNQPVVEGDKISTGESSRGEVQLDHANTLRLAERAQANITGLSRTQIQLQLGQGLANYSLLRDSEADVEIDTPNMSLHPSRREGSYRIRGPGARNLAGARVEFTVGYRRAPCGHFRQYRKIDSRAATRRKRVHQKGRMPISLVS